MTWIDSQPFLCLSQLNTTKEVDIFSAMAKTISMSLGGASGRNGMAIALLSVSGIVSKRLKYSRRNTDGAHWRKLKREVVKEMRYLSKLRHPCVTTVMGKLEWT